MGGSLKQGWIGALVGCAAGLCASMAVAQQNPVVVELYTSQGCASCPPADALMAELAQRQDVIALALHVDYWDYLGWADSFADPAFTKRQKRYARAHGQKMIYTPQMIVGGVDAIQGNLSKQVMAKIESHVGAQPRVALRAHREGGLLRVEVDANPPLERAAIVQLVRYLPHSTVLIERGENAGREASYHNIVSEWTAMAEWPGEAPLRLEVAAEGNQPLVVIVQEAGPGAVLAAARLD